MIRPKIKIHQPQIIQKENKVIFSALIESSSVSKTLWYSLDKEFAPLICDYGDAPLVALLVPAMACGEDIHLAGSISERLLYVLSGPYQHLLQCMLPGLKKINIYPADVEARQHKAAGVATGFSAGIDSFCVLADHFYSSTTAGFKITHLLFNNVGSHGGGEAGEILFEKRYASIARLAKKLGLPFIKINTNIDSFYEKYDTALNFLKTHTLRNVSAALLLQQGIKRYMYASTYSLTDLQIKSVPDIALGDPLSIPLLSTEGLDILSVGSEYTRVEKTLRVAEMLDSHNHLNVCVSGTAENCSRCWKCTRTLLTLEIGGVLERYRNVFQLNTYNKHRKQHIAEILRSTELLAIEVIDFAKKNNFTLPSHLEIKCYGLFMIIKNILFLLKQKIKMVLL